MTLSQEPLDKPYLKSEWNDQDYQAWTLYSSKGEILQVFNEKDCKTTICSLLGGPPPEVKEALRKETYRGQDQMSA